MAWPDCLHYTLRKHTPKTVMRRENSRGEWIEILSRCGESFRFPRLRLATRRQLSGASGAGKAALEANFAVTRSWLRFRWGTCGGLPCAARRAGRGVRGIAGHGIRNFITDPFLIRY